MGDPFMPEIRRIEVNPRDAEGVDAQNFGFGEGMGMLGQMIVQENGQ